MQWSQKHVCILMTTSKIRNCLKRVMHPIITPWLKVAEWVTVHPIVKRKQQLNTTRNVGESRWQKEVLI